MQKRTPSLAMIARAVMISEKWRAEHVISVQAECVESVPASYKNEGYVDSSQMVMVFAVIIVYLNKKESVSQS
jgi:hypothetical protein